jgi:serine/threonine protein kinase
VAKHSENPDPYAQRRLPEIPDFELVRLIGEGAFGQVWLATNRTTGSLRAVKIIPMRRAARGDPASREITSLTRLEASLPARHPNLIDIDHVGKTADHLFYVMAPADDVSGRPASLDNDYRPATIESLLANGPLRSDECWSHAEQLLSGLAALHTAGMVHRDVKPANCLIVGGRLKLADFGLVTESDPLVSRMGTEAYMPPDGRMDTRADVYAAGLVIHEMITSLPTGRFPSLGSRAVAIAGDPLLSVLNRIALKACQLDREKRFRDASEMLGELAVPKSGARGRRTMSRRTAGVLSVCALLATVMTIYGLIFMQPPDVSVNFITEPFEATVYLDGELQVDADNRAYTTPCTIRGLRPRVYHLVFKHEGIPDRNLGDVDLGEVREIRVELDRER